MSSSVVSLGASVSIAPDQEPEGYGATLIRIYDAAGREVRREVRGRELELLDIVMFIELDDGEPLVLDFTDEVLGLYEPEVS